MELRVIGRGALSGLVAGVFAFVFARIFAEPVINKAIAYESGRNQVLADLARAADRAVAPDGPEIFSRNIQSTVGIATGIIGFSIAMGALVAVAFVVLQGRFQVRVRTLALLIPLFGFLGVFLVPFVKYPANPPAIGHEFTITTRGHLFLTMLVCSLVLLSLAVYVGAKLTPRYGRYGATLVAGLGFVVLTSVVVGVLPSLGNLHANVEHASQFGFARASTETPQPITDLQGTIVYPGFSADVLWTFRWYALINQVIIWGGTGLGFAFLMERLHRPAPRVVAPELVST